LPHHLPKPRVAPAPTRAKPISTAALIRWSSRNGLFSGLDRLIRLTLPLDRAGAPGPV
jgi:hypothetical protein